MSDRPGIIKEKIPREGEFTLRTDPCWVRQNLQCIKPGKPKNLNACFDFYMPRILRYSSAIYGDLVV